VIGWPDNTLTTTPPTPPIDWDVDTPGTYSGLKEAWNLTFSKRNGKVVSTQEVVVDRSKTARVGDPCTKKRRR